MQNLNMSVLADITISRPSIEEQNRIEKLLQAADNEELTARNQLDKYLILKTALMQDLLTGKKRVTTLLNNREATKV
jgi:type I restriction enzyme S subunit